MNVRLMQTYLSAYKGFATWLHTSSQQTLQQGYAATLQSDAAPSRQQVSPDCSVAVQSEPQRIILSRDQRRYSQTCLTLLYETLLPQVHIILAVHDELVLECPEALARKAEQILKDAMVQACRTYLKIVHIPEPDVLIAPYWKKD